MENDEDDGLYDEVTEEEYQALVRKRQANDDFVVDDNGLGYADDGEEYLQRQLDDEDLGKDDKKQKSSKRNMSNSLSCDALKKARKLNRLSMDKAKEEGGSASIRQYMKSTNRAVGPGAMPAPLNGAVPVEKAGLDLDSMLDDLVADPLSDVKSSTSKGQEGMGFLTERYTTPVGHLKNKTRNSTSGSKRHRAFNAWSVRDVAGGAEESPPQKSEIREDGTRENDIGEVVADTEEHDSGCEKVNSPEDVTNGQEPRDSTTRVISASSTKEEEQQPSKPAPPKSRFVKLKAFNEVKASAATQSVLQSSSNSTLPPADPFTIDKATLETDTIDAIPKLDMDGIGASAYSFDIEPPPSHATTTTTTTCNGGVAATGNSIGSQFLSTNLNNDDHLLHMYCFDACEENGMVYLFGKARRPSSSPSASTENEGGEMMKDKRATTIAPSSSSNSDNPEYVSVCMRVDGMERTLLVLPRVDESAVEHEDGKRVRHSAEKVYHELRQVLSKVASDENNRVTFRLKPVKRKYAFRFADVPREDTTWLKVKYPAHGPGYKHYLNEEVCSGGKTYQRIFGANTDLLEDFIVRRKLMGPCWVTIRNPYLLDTPSFSHCRVEFGVSSPKYVNRMHPDGPDGTGLPSAPPLVSLSLSMKTVIHPSTHTHEIVMIAGLVHKSINLDGNTKEDPKLMTPWVGIRPLDSAAGSNQPKKFPHDLDTVLKQVATRFRSAPVMKFNKEREMLSVFFQKVLGNCDPDIITAHNLWGFDLEVILKRCKDLKINGRLWSKLGRIIRQTMPQNTGGNGKKQFGGWATRNFVQRVVRGRIMCDTYLGAKEFLREERYSLSYLCRKHLKVQRQEVDSGDIPLLYSHSSRSISDLAHHTIGDAGFVQRLMLHLQLVPLTKQLTCVSGNQWARTLQGQRAERNTFLLLHEFHRLKYVTPEKVWNNNNNNSSGSGSRRKKAAYAGGLVLEPKKGLYDDYILLLDFNSLYPSIIQEYNLCFTTIDWASLLNEKGGSVCDGGHRSGTAADEDGMGGGLEDDDVDEGAVCESVHIANVPDEGIPTGVLPLVIRSLVARRRQVKNMLKKEKNPGKWQELDIRQKALKLTANSMYGCLGFSNSRFCAKPIAALVTAMGRDALQKTVDVTERELNMDVIYGDTDSVMVSTKSHDLAVAREMGDKVKCAVNKYYRGLELDLDGIFKSMLLLKKKKYAALVVAESADGNVTYEKELKGLDLVRRDWCRISKETGLFVLDCILSGDAKEDVVDAIHSYLESVALKAHEGQIALEKFIISKGISKNPEDYPNIKTQPHLQVAIAMKKEGKAVNPGDIIPYVICLPPVGDDRMVSPSQVKLEEQPATPITPATQASSSQGNNAVLSTGSEPSSVVSGDEMERTTPDTPFTPREKLGGGILQDAKLGITNNSNLSFPLPLQQQQHSRTSSKQSIPPAERAFHPDTVVRSGGKLVPDIEWYLEQQIVPPIARLVEHIDGTNRSIIAEKLGLDPNKLQSSSGIIGDDGEQAEDWAFTPAISLSDEERFRACSHLLVCCLKCNETSIFTGPIRAQDLTCPIRSVSDLKSGLCCPSESCKSSLWGCPNGAACFSLIYQRVVLAIRQCLCRYYDAWLVCDDSSCGRRTQQIGVREGACNAPGCAGRMKLEYGDKALYEQIKYFETLFDVEHSQERLATRHKLCKTEIRIHLEDSAIFKLLNRNIQDYIQSCAYNFIDPGVWASVFSKTIGIGGTKH